MVEQEKAVLEVANEFFIDNRGAFYSSLFTKDHLEDLIELRAIVNSKIAWMFSMMEKKYVDSK